ncbi:MAG: hypothetical protein HKN17_05245, partial [Rhodothermales bacterium]|nr:hypothetical protein [Rhodothermales bacterium]
MMPRLSFRTAAISFCIATIGLLFGVDAATAQYFGRNKVQYDDFEFRQFNTDHFEFYYYPEEKQAVSDAARMA